MNVTDFMQGSEQTEMQSGFTPVLDKEEEIPSGRQLSQNAVIELLVLTFICVFGTIGNSLVVSVYSRKKHREISASLYMLNLAIADLMTLIVVVAVQLTEFFPQTWPVLWRSDTQCAVHRWGRFLTTAVTVYIMIAISVDRYIAVVHPFSYKTGGTPKRTKYVLVFIWLMSAMLSIPPATKFKTKYTSLDSSVDSSGDACFVDRAVPTWFKISFRLYLSFVFSLIPATITGLVYTVLLVHVWRHNKDFSANIRSSKDSSSLLNQWKIAKVLLAVYLGFLFCYVPYLIFQFSLSFNYDLPDIFANISVLLPYANSCVNPIIYLLWSKSFRSNVRFLFFPKSNETSTTRERKTMSDIIA